MIRWTPRRIGEAVGGRLLGAGDAPLRGLSTDTRALEPGQAFAALRGERYDAHDFLEEAHGRGAGLLIVEREGAVPAGAPALVVGDTRRALADLARVYRASLPDLRVLAVTGSNGKTTACRLLHAALGSALRGSASPRSFNNDVGVPLTLLSAREGDAYLVCEIGSNSPGEIAPLSRLAAPDVAIITSIGRAHLEALGDLDGVRREKTAIAEGLRDDGPALIPAGDDALRAHLAGRRVETFGTGADADHRVEDIRTEARDGADGTTFALRGERYWIPLLGAHNALTGGAVVAAALAMGVAPEDIRRGLARAQAPPMRFQRRSVGGIDVYNDAYNANPDSTAAAIRTFAEAAVGPGRRVVVLGAMLELGEHAEEAHREVGRMVADDPRIDLLIGVGGLASLAVRELSKTDAARALSVGELERPALERIALAVEPGDAVLLKGSRGARLERVEAALAAAERVAG